MSRYYEDDPALGNIFPTGFGPRCGLPATKPVTMQTPVQKYAASPQTPRAQVIGMGGRGFDQVEDSPMGMNQYGYNAPRAAAKNQRYYYFEQRQDPDIDNAPYPSGFDPRNGEKMTAPCEPSKQARPLKKQQQEAWHQEAPPIPAPKPIRGEERRFRFDKQDPEFGLERAPFPGGFEPKVVQEISPAAAAVPIRRAEQEIRTARQIVTRELRSMAEDEEECRVEPENRQAIMEVHDQVSKVTRKMEEMAGEVSTIETLMDKAEELRCRAEMAHREAEKARELAEATRTRAEQLPQVATQRLVKKKEELADAKENLASVARDLKTAEQDVEHAEFSERAKREEWKIVTRAAKAKKAEVEELERMLARLQQLKKDAEGAEHRAEVVTRELESNQLQLRDKRRAKEQRARLLAEVEAAITNLYQQFAMVLADFETAEQRQVRERREATFLNEVVDQKLAQAEAAAQDWRKLQDTLQRIGKQQQAALKEACEVSNQLYTNMEEGLVQKLRPPAFLERERERRGEFGEQKQELPPEVRAATAKPLTQMQEAGPEEVARGERYPGQFDSARRGGLPDRGPMRPSAAEAFAQQAPPGRKEQPIAGMETPFGYRGVPATSGMQTPTTATLEAVTGVMGGAPRTVAGLTPMPMATTAGLLPTPSQHLLPLQAAASIQQTPTPYLEPELPSAPQTKIPTSAMPSPGMATPASGGIAGMGAGAAGTPTPRQNLYGGDRFQTTYQTAFGSPTKASSPAATEEPLLAQPVPPSVEATAPPTPARLEQQETPRYTPQETPQETQALMQEVRAKPTTETLERTPAVRQVGGEEGPHYEERPEAAGGQQDREMREATGGQQGMEREEERRERERDAAREAGEGQREGEGERQGQLAQGQRVEGHVAEPEAESHPAESAEPQKQHQSMIGRIIDAVLPIGGSGGEKKPQSPAAVAGDPKAETEQDAARRTSLLA